MDSSKHKMIKLHDIFMVLLIFSERIKKGFKNLENKRKTLVFNYEFQSKLIERNKTCSATAKEEQKKLLSEFLKDCDRLQAEYDKWLPIVKRLNIEAARN
ncbi:hypothetical protein KY290_027415 [Solanum tuberosum]|uniref:Uncharacterized protein n=1 Tax=Solanum tuberosum TaxID=4113 RepID=A0ABQ7UG76_SOLTU|nr:hypothetical protein KY289_026597 [Solanum tuberosum]KAH0748183.1 hypothetical protein KY290_027415 [Solanum tuberosum]